MTECVPGSLASVLIRAEGPGELHPLKEETKKCPPAWSPADQSLMTADPCSTATPEETEGESSSPTPSAVDESPGRKFFPSMPSIHPVDEMSDSNSVHSHDMISVSTTTMSTSNIDVVDNPKRIGNGAIQSVIIPNGKDGRFCPAKSYKHAVTRTPNFKRAISPFARKPFTRKRFGSPERGRPVSPNQRHVPTRFQRPVKRRTRRLTSSVTWGSQDARLQDVWLGSQTRGGSQDVRIRQSTQSRRRSSLRVETKGQKQQPQTKEPKVSSARPSILTMSSPTEIDKAPETEPSIADTRVEISKSCISAFIAPSTAPDPDDDAPLMPVHVPPDPKLTTSFNACESVYIPSNAEPSQPTLNLARKTPSPPPPDKKDAPQIRVSQIGVSQIDVTQGETFPDLKPWGSKEQATEKDSMRRSFLMKSTGKEEQETKSSLVVSATGVKVHVKQNHIQDPQGKVPKKSSYKSRQTRALSSYSKPRLGTWDEGSHDPVGKTVWSVSSQTSTSTDSFFPSSTTAESNLKSRRKRLPFLNTTRSATTYSPLPFSQTYQQRLMNTPVEVNEALKQSWTSGKGILPASNSVHWPSSRKSLCQRSNSHVPNKVPLRRPIQIQEPTYFVLSEDAGKVWQVLMDCFTDWIHVQHKIYCRQREIHAAFYVDVQGQNGSEKLHEPQSGNMLIECKIQVNKHKKPSHCQVDTYCDEKGLDRGRWAHGERAVPWAGLRSKYYRRFVGELRRKLTAGLRLKNEKLRAASFPPTSVVSRK